ncbi:transcriptional regulator [Variovorax robiniae]|uniref:Transcriptional regulator n=1 Tax=Variovorax robiniae TaxID=1836199 RepID=A0ABU8XFG8_9BURK
MEVHAIRTEAAYRAALREVSALVDLDPEIDTPEGERLDVLGTLVQAYEARHYPIDPPDPVDAIKFRMDQAGLSVADMVPYIGPPNRVYEVLNRKRSLTLNMIRRLAELGIPAEVLIGHGQVHAAA